MDNRELDTQAPIIPYGFNSSVKGDLLDKINPERVVESTKQRLMGKVYNQQTKKWETSEHLKDNAVSELCANDMATLILSVSNQNVSISKLKDMEIRKRALAIMNAAILNVLAKCYDYHITNSSQITFLGEIVFSLAFITMKQADAEGIRKMIVGTRQETHNIAEYSEGKPKRDLFGRRK